MGNDAGEVVERVPYPSSFKVHHTMCTELKKLVDRISKILPDIEAARPRCSSGLQSLCSLNSAIDRAKLLLQHCCDCSKLYLAVTGDVILSRCHKARKSLEQSLDNIQGMVSVILAAQISQIIDDLGCVKFDLDPSEEEAGRVVRELLQISASASDSMEDSEIKALQIAAARLNITSPKTILMETRSIKKFLRKLGPNELTKKMILRYLLYLLKKYGNHITGEQIGKVFSRSDEQNATDNSCQDPSHSHYGLCRTHTHELHRVIPPEDYKCPISSKLMYDPVVIDSGVTFERMWIQKWFEEGHDTCPTTGKKLAHMSMTPNNGMKELISKWCRDNGVTVPDPNRRAENFIAWEASSFSIRSVAISMSNLHLPLDLSSMSLGSVDSYGSDSSQALTNDNSDSHQSHAHMEDADLMLLSKFPDLQWDSQCQVVENLKTCLRCKCQAFGSLSSENFIELLVKFLNVAYDLQDIKALSAGTQLLSEFVNKCRNSLTCLNEDTFSMLGSLLDSKVIGEALAITEELSECQHSRAKIAASSALTSILKILSKSREFQNQAIRIMYNLSFDREACSHMVSLQCIPELEPFFKDEITLRYCICMLKNLCDIEEGRDSVAKTEGCVSAIVEALETDSNEEQEHALAVLLSLCSQSLDYCKLVMDQGVIPSLVLISKNGNDKGKVSALELLRLLRDIVSVENEECFESTSSTPQDPNDHFQLQKKSLKISAFFRKFLSMFSKTS